MKEKGKMTVWWRLGLKGEFEILGLRLFSELATILGNRRSSSDYLFYRLWTLREKMIPVKDRIDPMRLNPVKNESCTKAIR